ncbi:MAG: TetR/AcrR family transcriptional regulator [Spirochaetota bacterium]
MGVQERKAREFKKREEKIRKVAVALLKKKHPSQITMDTIAKKVEIGRGTLYLHFKSKDDLMASIVLEFYCKLRVRFESIPASASSEEKVRALVKQFIQYSLEDRALYKVIKSCSDTLVQANVSQEVADKTLQERKRRLQIFEATYHDIKQSGKLANFPLFSHVGAIWGMLQGAIDLIVDGHFANEIVDLEEYFVIVESILFQGIFSKTVMV